MSVILLTKWGFFVHVSIQMVSLDLKKVFDLKWELVSPPPN